MPKEPRDLAPMTRAEQSDLLKLIRTRERVAKSAAAQRAAELKAEFEAQISRRYSFDERPVWKAAMAAADQAVEEARQKIAAECARWGIPKEWGPSISRPDWYCRGENAVASRRAELRKLAYAKIDALEKQARVKIERMSCDFQTNLIANGLSEATKAFLEQMPSMETLMPALDVEKTEQQLLEQKSSERSYR